MPTLNELLEARGHFGSKVAGGKRWNEYNSIKKGWEHHIGWLVRAQHLEPVDKAYFTYVFFEKSRRRDPSNVVAVGVKIVEDALHKAGILKNDGWGQVLGFSAFWEVDAKNPGIAVFLSKHAPLDRAAALYNDELQRK
jgi:hypothetical protein